MDQIEIVLNDEALSSWEREQQLIDAAIDNEDRYPWLMEYITGCEK